MAKPPNSVAAIFALTRKGAALAARVSERMPGSACFCHFRYALPGMTPFRRLSDVFRSAWNEYQGLICIMGCGIAVRMLAPLVKDKMADPAVVVLDQDGRFAISLLSGHIGGANELARMAASITGGQAVITTASDLQEKMAVDLLAMKAGLEIENRRMLGRIEAAILDEDPLWLFDPEGLFAKRLPAGHGLQVISSGTEVKSGHPGRFRRDWMEFMGDELSGFRAGPGIWVSEYLAPAGVRCLRLRPRTLVIGIGCNRGTSSGEIVSFVKKTLRENRFSPLSIRNFASIDLKSDEPGLLDAVSAFKKEIHFCTREQISGISVPNPSKTVARHIGAESVCEASALWSAETRELLLPKQKAGNCTLAIARANSP